MLLDSEWKTQLRKVLDNATFPFLMSVNNYQTYKNIKQFVHEETFQQYFDAMIRSRASSSHILHFRLRLDRSSLELLFSVEMISTAPMDDQEKDFLFLNLRIGDQQLFRPTRHQKNCFCTIC